MPSIPSAKKQPETSYGFEPGSEPLITQPKPLPRIGIYSGSFNPVHAGHIVFALKAREIAGLDEVYFVPERRPLRDSEPEHYVHRSIMLQRALRPYPRLHVLDLPDARLNSRSLTRLADDLPPARLSLLTTASQLLWHKGDMPGLYQAMHLVIAVTSHAQMAEVLARLTAADMPLGNLTFIDIGTGHIRSTEIRKGLRLGQPVRGVLPSVWHYARRHWLYLPLIRREGKSA